jgi:hypothetical protein
VDVEFLDDGQREQQQKHADEPQQHAAWQQNEYSQASK